MFKKVGILDSGIGGFSLVQEIVERKLDVELYYISDRDNVPYGSKSQSFMLERSRLMVEALLEQEVDCILLACNTLTVETIDSLRRDFKVPFVGIEPYIKIPFDKYKKHTTFAMILTPATYHSKKFEASRKNFDKNNIIDVYPMENLANSIETYYSNSDKSILKKVEEELKVKIIKNYDYIILGCTHYPLISTFISRTLGTICIDPHKFVIDQLIKVTGSSQNKGISHFIVKENIKDPWDRIKACSIYIDTNI